ncbi:Uncharacterised protein [Burkholderia pseudomallei]|nr:Uncharacterised protein [Burkholderia pseudomallei]CAJ4668113.1 Uncharacterised protein [Burkholderia pseudomallei]VBM94885.1 Uncharacterised protein [Burkholderia pseudomallei]VBX79525.1 Uncharacterised protein [Burkholderia pseudomallei]VBX79559.1 Uncharacterised protein [Burkholderia pseudomallei]
MIGRLLIGAAALLIVLGVAIVHGAKRIGDDEHHRH